MASFHVVIQAPRLFPSWGPIIPNGLKVSWTLTIEGKEHGENPCMLQPFCDSMDCRPPGSSVHGISQTRILEWVAISFPRGSSWPRDRSCVSCVSCIGRQILYHWATWRKPMHFLEAPSQNQQIPPIHSPLARINLVATPGYQEGRNLKSSFLHQFPEHKLARCVCVIHRLIFLPISPTPTWALWEQGFVFVHCRIPSWWWCPKWNLGESPRCRGQRKAMPKGRWNVKGRICQGMVRSESCICLLRQEKSVVWAWCGRSLVVGAWWRVQNGQGPGLRLWNWDISLSTTQPNCQVPQW